MARRSIRASMLDVISQVSSEMGVPFDTMRKFAGIESSFRPNLKTPGKGTYKGLYQLSNAEFKRGGGRGNIFDPKANATAFANVIKEKSASFQKDFGRPPSGAELYLLHQQGEGGARAHLKNPDEPAWKNMYRTAEGRKKGVGWAQDAIWGNIPTKAKARFGNDVNNVSGRDMVNFWTARYNREGTSDKFDTSAPRKDQSRLNSAQDGLQRNMPKPETLADLQGKFDNGNGVMFGGPPISAETGAPMPPPKPSQFEMPPVREIGQANSGIIPPTPSRAPGAETPQLSAMPSVETNPIQRYAGTVQPSSTAAPPVGSLEGNNWGGQAVMGDLFKRPDMGGSLTRQISSGLSRPPQAVPLFRSFFGF